MALSDRAKKKFLHALQAFVEEIPVVGGAAGVLLGGVIEDSERKKILEAQYADLKNSLPDRLRKLKASLVPEEYKKLYDDTRKVAEEFNDFVEGLVPTKHYVHMRLSNEDLKLFESKLDAFNESMTKFKDEATELEQRLIAEISKRVDVIKDVVEKGAKTNNETNADVKKAIAKLDELSETVVSVLLPLVKLLVNPEYAQKMRQGSGGTVSFDMDAIGDVLATLQTGNKRQKRAAMHDAVRIALGFVRDGNERAVAMGLALLDRIIGDANSRRLIMKNASVVRTLLGREMKHPGDNTVSWMLEHLAEESKSFFDQLEPLAMQPKYHSAIASAGLIPWVVEGAKPTAVEQDQDQEAGMEIGDEVALCVLVEIAKSSECKSAIVEAGGIGVLVEDYRLLELNEYEVDLLIIDVADALAGLAEDAVYHEQFAEAHGDWALLDFLWKCGITKTERPAEDEEDSEHHGVFKDGVEVTESTKFDRATALPAESKAGRALWTLAALGGKWRHRVLYLGELYIKSINRDLDFDNPRELRGAAACPQFDAVRGWLRLSNFVEEAQLKAMKRTYWCVPIVWSLLMDKSTSFIAAEWCFGGDLSDHRRCESAVFKVEDAAKYGEAYIKWNLHESEDIKEYEWTPCSSDEESLDAESSDAESSDVESSDAEASDAEASDAEASVAESSVAESSDAEASDEDVSSGDEKRQREERSAVDRALIGDRGESQLIVSICSYLALPRDNCKHLSTCLLRVLWALEAGTTDRRAKALCVLWLSAGFLNIYRTPVNRLAEICKKAMTSGREDEIFWATCLLLTMVSWPSVREKRPRTRRVEMVEVAATGVCELLKSDEWTKYVFLSKYLVAKEVGVMGAVCIPFLVASYLKLKKAGEVLNDDSYFQSKTHRDSKPLSEKELREDCLEQLGWLWSNHASEITAEGGVPVMKAMVKSDRVDDDDKSSIKRALQDTVTDTVNDTVKDAVTDTVEEGTKQLSQDTVP